MPLIRKLLFCLTAVVLCAALFAGCAARPAPEPTPEPTKAPEPTPEPTSELPGSFELAEPSGTVLDPDDLMREEAFTPFCAYVGWTEFTDVLPYCLNGEIISKTMMLSSVLHLPVFAIGTADELEGFRAGVGQVLQLDGGYDEAPSFNELAEGWDEDFFSDKALVFAWIESGSGSYRYGFTGAERADGVFRIYADRINDPEVGTDDMAGWLVGIEVPKAALADCTEFDAMYGRPME